MKANRKFVQGDDAVSPVIAVILMVAITVVLAATVYLWVSGFGSEQNKLVQASFAAKAVDLPTLASTPAPAGDSDSSDDAIEITYTSGSGDLSWSDIEIFIDGVQLATNSTAGTNSHVDSGDLYCTSLPGGRTTGTSWNRGESVFLWKAVNAGADADDCRTAAASPGLDGIHLLKVVVKGQVVLDTQLEVHDSIL